MLQHLPKTPILFHAEFEMTWQIMQVLQQTARPSPRRGSGAAMRFIGGFHRLTAVDR